MTGEAPRESATQLGYQPALDGIRALAVLAVLLYHSGYTWMSGGFLGVDVFFVLSGFLITSLLLGEWSVRSTISLPAFYQRRARRLLPALFALLIGGVPRRGDLHPGRTGAAARRGGGRGPHGWRRPADPRRWLP